MELLAIATIVLGTSLGAWMFTPKT